jgi:uncharacterized 2Fe-2S/4Fe-4S cluster protein (DUF4445 family)
MTQGKFVKAGDELMITGINQSALKIYSIKSKKIIEKTALPLRVGYTIETNGEDLYIAGGFGNYLNVKSAQRIGLLPNIDIDKIEYVGNSSLKGASKALIDASLTNKLNLIVAEVEHIDLSMNLDFQMEFANAMIFPEA